MAVGWVEAIAETHHSGSFFDGFRYRSTHPTDFIQHLAHNLAIDGEDEKMQSG